MTNIDRAVSAWLAGSDGMFEFCIEAAAIVGNRIEGETIALGKKINRSPDTVERYAKVGVLWWAMLQKFPDATESIRELLDYQYWLALAPLWTKNLVSLAGVKHWFDEAIKCKWDYDFFVKQLPQGKTADSEWQKTARRAATLIDDLIMSPAFDVDEVRYKAGLKLLKMASSWLKGMTMSNIIELLISEKIAKNGFNAAAIANGLRLSELKTEEEQLKRARLYRDWRVSKIYPDTKTCFEMAIKGEPVPQMELIEGVMHSSND